MSEKRRSPFQNDLVTGLGPIIFLVVWMAALVCAGWYVHRPEAGSFDRWRQFTYLLSMLAGGFWLAAIGRSKNGDWKGVFIAEYNRVSLSRFQFFMWTIVTFPAIAVTVAWNITVPSVPATAGKPASEAIGFLNAFGFNIPAAIWGLVGISATTLVAAGIIRQQQDAGATQSAAVVGGDPVKVLDSNNLQYAQTGKALAAAKQKLDDIHQKVNDSDSTKQDQIDAATHEVVAAQKAYDDAKFFAVEWEYKGNIATHPRVGLARFHDLYLAEIGDPTANTPEGRRPPLDFNRLQQLYLSLIMVCGYAAILFKMFGGKGWIAGLPEFSEGALTLAIVSHASYIIGKVTGKASG